MRILVIVEDIQMGWLCSKWNTSIGVLLMPAVDNGAFPNVDHDESNIGFQNRSGYCKKIVLL